jgi:hypothetical protein
VSTEAARQRIAAAEQHAAQLIAEAEAKAEAIRGSRDELTGRLLQARQLLTTLPDLSDRAQDAEAPTAPAPQRTPEAQRGQAAAPAAEAERRPQPAQQSAPQPAQQPQAAAPATAPSQPATQPAPQSARAEGEAAAARQPTRSPEPATRQLPMPPRGTTGSTAAPAGPTGPATQAIDAPVGQGRH